jgi:competence protein ComEC
MKRPLVGLVAVYAAGIWIGSLAEWPVGWWMAAAFVLLIAFGGLCRTRFSVPVLLGLVACMGLLSARFATTSLYSDDLARVVAFREQAVRLRGTIASEPEDRVGRSVFFLDLSDVEVRGAWQPAVGRVYVFFNGRQTGARLRYGDVIECNALLRMPPAPRNPAGFDLREWLARQGAAYTATVRKDEFAVILARDRGDALWAVSLRVRAWFQRALKLGLEDEPGPASVLAGLVIGERAEIPTPTMLAFQRTGVAHVFSVSGLNVALVAGVMLVALRMAHVPRRWCALGAIPALVLYVLATGAKPGATRSLVMAVALLMGWALERPVDVLNSLAGAAMGLLLWNPLQLFDGGFILSFIVVAAIVALTPRIEKILLPLLQPDPLLPEQLLPAWRTWLQPYLDGMIRLVSCSVAAWVGLLPLMAEYFHLFSPVCILANVVVVPALGMITAMGLMAAAAFPVAPWLALIFNNASFFLLEVMIRAVEWLDRIPWGHWHVPAPPGWLTAAYYAAGILLLNRWWKTAAAVGAATGVAILWGVWNQPLAEVTVLSLKGGPCIFINLPGKNHDVLIDGGGDRDGRQQVLPYLRAAGVERLGAAIVTRADKAHAAGFSAIMEEIPVREIIHSGVRTRSSFYEDWLSGVKTNQVSIRTVRAGDHFDCETHLRVRVLNPPADASANRSDDNSLVLLLDFGSTRMLVMSDAGAGIERQLLQHKPDLRAPIILKGRHSTELSCANEFLDAVAPSVIVQCVSSWRLASGEPEFVPRLRSRGIQFLPTDSKGAVTFRVTKTGYTVHTCRQDN